MLGARGESGWDEALGYGWMSGTSSRDSKAAGDAPLEIFFPFVGFALSAALSPPCKKRLQLTSQNTASLHP